MVTLLYILTNFMYLGVLPLNEIANAPNDRVGIAAAAPIFGQIGTYILAVFIVIPTFGCLNGMIISGARVYYTMAQDKLFFKTAASLNKKTSSGQGTLVASHMGKLIMSLREIW